MQQRIIETAARWYVFIFLNVYGLGKIFGGQFYTPDRIPPEVASTPLGSAEAFDLAWTFMGYSFTYILFIGLAEVVGAWLLLWERTKLLGVLILLPIMANILVFDVVFLDKYGALASATIYTALLFVILYINRENVWRAFQALTTASPDLGKPLAQKAKVVGLALAAMAVLFAFDQLLVNIFGHGKG
ncbi:MAG: hypothetical protein KJO98_07315 [Rhodothermia bacterium]|nr:hypothetical protein [Rhodothermia bacterium]